MLKDSKCVHIRKDIPPMPLATARKLLAEVPGWALEDSAIARTFKFENFDRAMEFVDRIADLARENDHHPDILISFVKVTLRLWTHNIGGLSINDFVLAAKINEIA